MACAISAIHAPHQPWRPPPPGTRLAGLSVVSLITDQILMAHALSALRCQSRMRWGSPRLDDLHLLTQVLAGICILQLMDALTLSLSLASVIGSGGQIVGGGQNI